MARRQLDHLRRLGVALRLAGPGRVAGAVSGLTATDDLLTITGWADVTGRSIDAIAIWIDGVLEGVALPGEPTPGEAGDRAARRSDLAGWSLRVGRRPTAGPTVLVDAAVVVDGSVVERLHGRQFPLPPRTSFPTGALEEPATDATVTPPLLEVRGWVLTGDAIDAVEVLVGDAPVQRARLCAAPTPELATLTDHPAAPLAGWELTVQLNTPEGSELTIVATAVGRDGPVELGRATVGVAEPAPPADAGPGFSRLVATATRFHRDHRAAPARKGLHLAVVTHDLGLGGGQLYLHELLRHLLAKGDIACTVLAPRPGPLAADLTSWGASVRTADAPPLQGPAYEGYLMSVGAEVAAAGANVVLANTMGAFHGIDLAGRIGVPAVWAIHESYDLDRFVAASYPSGPVDPYVVDRIRRAFHTARAVVFEADATRHLLSRLGDEHRFIRIDYGVSLDDIDTHRATFDREVARARQGFRPDDVMVLCVGTYEPRKAQGQLMQAFARVAADHPEAQLVLVGDMGTPFATAVHHLAHRSECREQIRLVPVVAGVHDWYAMADVFVIASDVESLPRSVLEVMAFGVPVLATNVFGLGELITDGENGVLVEPFDVGALAGGLDRILSATASERARIGKAGEEMVRATRDSRGYAEDYRRLLEGLLNHPDALPARFLPGTSGPLVQ